MGWPRRDTEKCDIQIRLPEVSKVQAILTADGHGQARATPAAMSAYSASLPDHRLSAGQVWFENLSATNPGGTLLNDEIVASKRMLATNDMISICGRRFRFEYGALTRTASAEQTHPLPRPP